MEAPVTIAGYPLRVERLRAGDLRVRLLVVSDLEQLVDRAALLRDAAVAEPPYWAYLWTASRVLARLVADGDHWRGARVVEVGCGLGLAGIVAAMKGAVVTAADMAAEALAIARASAGLNGCGIEVVRDDLRRSSLAGPFDCCLAADVAYEPSMQSGLASFLDSCLAPRGYAWCVDSVRTRDTGFRDACEARALRVVEWEVMERDDGHAVPVRVVRVQRR